MTQTTDIQVNFEELDGLCKHIDQHQQSIKSQYSAMTQHIETMSQTGFIGRGANEFYREMSSMVMPSWKNLMIALQDFESVLQVIRNEFEVAEEEARNIVNNSVNGDSDGNTDGHYTVKPGDTLWDIAQKYGVTVDDLVNANNIANRDLIHPGQDLIIPGEEQPTAAPTPAPMTNHGNVPPAKMNPQQLNRIIDSFNVETNPKYVPHDSPYDNNDEIDTWCNVYASDVVNKLGAPLPLSVETNTGTRWLGATLMKDWLEGKLPYTGNYQQGPQSGWQKVDPTTAAQYARQGHISVVAGHGHIAVVRADNPSGNLGKGDVVISQAGAHNFNRGTASQGWGRYIGEADFYVYLPN